MALPLKEVFKYQAYFTPRNKACCIRSKKRKVKKQERLMTVAEYLKAVQQ